MRLWRRRLPAGILLGLLVLAGLGMAAWQMAQRGSEITLVATAQTLSAARTDGGLQLTLSVPRGPYFRTELLPVTLVLANNSARPIRYSGTLSGRPCQAPAMMVTLAGGGQFRQNPLSTGPAWPCPDMRIPLTPLRPGRSLRLHDLMDLPAAGRLTFSTQAYFAPDARVETPGLFVMHRGWEMLQRLIPGLFRTGHAPFASGGPSLTIWASPRIPANRVLHLVRRGHTVYVQGYPRTLPSPVAQQGSIYLEGREGACFEGTSLWTPVGAGGVHDFGCGPTEHNEKWKLLVGAPGYATTFVVYCFNPVRTSAVFGGTVGYADRLRCTERIFEPGR